MPPKKNNRFEKNWAPPEKKWFHPPMTPEERGKYRHDFEQEGGDFSLAKAQAVTVVKKVFGFRHHEKATRFVMENADEIWLDGLIDAWKDFDPNHRAGATFKTFLYSILQNKARDERRKFFSCLPPKILQNIVTVRHLGIAHGESCYRVDENQEIVPRYTRFTFDFVRCDFSFLPCGLRLDNSLELVSDEILETEQLQATDAEGEMERNQREFLQRLGTMTEEDFHDHGREHLPNSYKKWTDERLMKELLRLDILIVDMLIGGDEPATQIAIQRELGITKYFYNARIEAILRRLEIPFDSMIRRVKATKRREKRRRNLDPIMRVEMDKLLIFSPPQPILITQTIDGKTRIEYDMREFGALSQVENEEILRWYGESDEPENFAGTPSEPIREVPKDALPYVINDFEHWELVDDSWFE